ncbi:MAG TPA: phenylalanine--tRNA ligase subunit beta [Candidatus Limnocylindrales bacterium]|nr:phenylalanine--tRNA ligase subunit beta [Candidatus Limnocylindrales bacterium]
MRVPLSWLRELVEFDLTPEALAERLTLLGMEVKGIEQRGAEWRNVVVGELLEVKPHPRADRLSLTRVRVGAANAGGEEVLDIVCGATNIAAGQRVPVALPGSVLPGDRRIERTEKMGVVSNGMLCSGDELRLTADGDGILILPADSAIGARLADLYGDVVLDVDVKPNRGDALSMVGIAREVAAVTGSQVRWPETDVEETGGPIEDHLRATVEDERLCPRFVGRWVSGVRIGRSPDRVQMRLLAAGQRPVSNVVDASNYVMLELGKPIHTFDAAAVGEGTIVVRRARRGEQLVTLDHVDRSLADDTLVIADPDGPIGIAGVMGGEASEIGAGTTDVVVESAIFDPVSIRRTAFRYALRSEASLRFEKGLVFRLARIGADYTARLIREWAGGEVARGRVDSHPEEPALRRVAFRPGRVDRLLGAELSADEQRSLLARVGIETAPAADGAAVPIVSGRDGVVVTAAPADVLEATVPTWRRDIEIEADIAEEVARVHGYERVPSTRPDTAPPPWRPNPLEVRDTIREALVGAGLTEVVTFALVSAGEVERYAWSADAPLAAGEGARAGDPIAVTNPLSQDHAFLRRALVGSLASIVDANLRHGLEDVAIFEVGKGYGRVGDAPREWWRLGLALHGAFERAAWNRPARLADVDDAKGLAELVAALLGAGPPTYQPLLDEPLLHPGRSATVSASFDDGSVALGGVVGELHPRVIAEAGLRFERLVVAELSVAGLSGGQLRTGAASPPPRFPSIERDLAVVVGDAHAAGAVASTIRGSGGRLLRDATLFDVYRGRPLAADERSLAFRLVFGDPERTLTEADVDAAIQGVVAALAAAHGARIRS